MDIIGELNYGINDYYPSALAEGEGVGTAYEYYAKAKIFKKFFRRIPTCPESMLIAGLPEKYGFSLDFLLLARGLGIKRVHIRDDREEKISRYLELAGEMAGEFDELSSEVGVLNDFPPSFDLAVSCEVLQRLQGDARENYLESCARSARNLVFFAPNAENPDHAQLSGLKTVKLNELRLLAEKKKLMVSDSGYIDMPPFPPGLTRSQDSRDQAQEKVLERIAMRGIQVWADMENYLPSGIRRKFSHIVYITLLGKG